MLSFLRNVLVILLSSIAIASFVATLCLASLPSVALAQEAAVDCFWDCWCDLPNYPNCSSGKCNQGAAGCEAACNCANRVGFTYCICATKPP